MSLLRTVATSVLAVAAVGGIYLAVRRSQPVVEVPAGREPEGAALIEGNDYRVLVAVARIKPEKPGGGNWDSGGSSSAAPDPVYEIWWRGTRVYESEEVEDVLVASWSNVALPELHQLLADQKISLETIKEGALVTARLSETIEIRIYDDDALDRDLIEEFTVGLSELRVGDQVREGRQGLESATLRVLPRDTQELRHFLR
jgi:hypothetical protein